MGTQKAPPRSLNAVGLFGFYSADEADFFAKRLGEEWVNSLLQLLVAVLLVKVQGTGIHGRLDLVGDGLGAGPLQVDPVKLHRGHWPLVQRHRGLDGFCRNRGPGGRRSTGGSCHQSRYRHRSQ